VFERSGAVAVSSVLTSHNFCRHREEGESSERSAVSE